MDRQNVASLRLGTTGSEKGGLELAPLPLAPGAGKLEEEIELRSVAPLTAAAAAAHGCLSVGRCPLSTVHCSLGPAATRRLAVTPSCDGRYTQVGTGYRAASVTRVHFACRGKDRPPRTVSHRHASHVMLDHVGTMLDDFPRHAHGWFALVPTLAPRLRRPALYEASRALCHRRIPSPGSWLLTPGSWLPSSIRPSNPIQSNPSTLPAPSSHQPTNHAVCQTFRPASTSACASTVVHPNTVPP